MHPSRIRTRLAALAAAAALAVGACGGQAAPTTLVVGLGYIPSVQFAPYYLADQKGYYRDAGLEVELQNKIDPDLVTLIGQGAVDIGSADGTSVIPAVSQGIPLVYAATIYGTFPSIVYAKTDAGIATAADLAGKRIGIPGKFGSSWVMLQALLASAGLTPEDVEVVLYPDFGQATALKEGAVDAATGFANNEPVQLRAQGVDTVVLSVDAYLGLPGPGLVTGKATIEKKADALRKFIAATLRAMEEIAADPQVGLDAAITAVPELAGKEAEQLEILKATIAIWTNDRTGGAFGSLDREGWQASIDYMTGIGLVPNPVTVDDLVTDDLLPGN